MGDFISELLSEKAVEELGDFMEELPTLQCGENGCHSCSVAFRMSCATMVPAKRAESEAAWDEPTQPDFPPTFIPSPDNFDDDYILDPNLGGEGG